MKSWKMAPDIVDPPQPKRAARTGLVEFRGVTFFLSRG